MAIRASVGRSLTHDSDGAGFAAAAEALAGLEGAAASVAIMFGTAGHDQQPLVDGVRRAIGATPLVGCSAEGVITQAGSSESSHVAAVMVVAATAGELAFHAYSVADFDRGAAGAAASLCEQIGDDAAAGGLLLPMMFATALSPSIGTKVEIKITTPARSQSQAYSSRKRRLRTSSKIASIRTTATAKITTRC